MAFSSMISGIVHSIESDLLAQLPALEQQAMAIGAHAANAAVAAEFVPIVNDILKYGKDRLDLATHITSDSSTLQADLNQLQADVVDELVAKVEGRFSILPDRLVRPFVNAAISQAWGSILPFLIPPMTTSLPIVGQPGQTATPNPIRKGGVG